MNKKRQRTTIFNHRLNACYGASESGVALITAILVTALATVASVAMLSRQQLDIRRVENILHFDQAYLYALGVEGAAAKYLENDPNTELDTKGEFDLFELYLGAGAGTEIEGGSLSGRISQLSGYFPLNNQIKDDGTQKTEYIQAFGELLEKIKDKNGNPELFTQGFEWVVADWIDVDDNVGPRGGAEDLDYSNRSYRTAGQAMQSLSELRLLDLSKEGFSALNGVITDPLTEEKQLGDPWVNALPNGAAININIVDEMVLTSVLHSFFSPIDASIVSKIIEERDKTDNDNNIIGIKQLKQMTDIIIGDLEKDDKIKFQNKDLLKNVKFDVKTEYFEAVSIAQIGNTVVELKTLMNRKKNKVTILRRGIGVY
jgi:general secretion pathway protein K